MKYPIATGLAALMLLLGGCAARGADNGIATATSPAEPYRLGAGDELRINVFGLDAANNSYLIGDSGGISVPLVGPVDAAGKTVAEVEAMVAESLRSRQIVHDPNVSVQIIKYRPFYILGEVQRPGQYPYVPGMTVLNAVSIAGGYTFRANSRRATIVRNAAAGASGGARTGAAGPETRVLPGDTVSIPESWF